MVSQHAMIQPMSNFSERLQAHLDNLGITKYQLRKLTGLSQTVCYNAVNGVRPPSDDVLKAIALAKEIGLSIQTLVDWRAEDEKERLFLELSQEEVKKGIAAMKQVRDAEK